MRKIGLIIGLFLLLGVLLPQPLYAQTPTLVQNTICDTIPDSGKQGECNSCMGDNSGVWTAIGCIKFGNMQDPDPSTFLEKLLSLGIGMGGGISFLLILFGGLQIMTSAGNPEQLNAGRELVSAAVTGLLLVIFSIFLLQFIGVNIIGIPGFRGV